MDTWLSTFLTERRRTTSEGQFITGAAGALVKQPAVRVQDQAYSQLLKLMTEFGMTAASRSKVKLTPPQGAGADEWDEFD